MNLPKVFLSSTTADLAQHRELVSRTLRALRMWVTTMEDFVLGGSVRTPLDECVTQLTSCDLYVGVLGARYGSVHQSGLSYTELEFDAASRLQIPRLIYMLSSTAPALSLDDLEDYDSIQKLRLFQQRAKQHLIARFTTPEELALKVATGVINTFLHGPVVNEAQEKVQEALSQLSVQTGYAVGLVPVRRALTKFLAPDGAGNQRFRNRRSETLVGAALIAAEIADGDVSVLDGYLSFDRDFWVALVALLRATEVDPEILANAIRTEIDGQKLRVLISLAGRLQLLECVQPMCHVLLHRRTLAREFDIATGPQATPFVETIVNALSSMPAAALPTVQTFHEQARTLKRWPQKRAFEKAIKHLHSGATDA